MVLPPRTDPSPIQNPIPPPSPAPPSPSNPPSHVDNLYWILTIYHHKQLYQLLIPLIKYLLCFREFFFNSLLAYCYLFICAKYALSMRKYFQILLLVFYTSKLSVKIKSIGKKIKNLSQWKKWFFLLTTAYRIRWFSDYLYPVEYLLEASYLVQW